MEKKLKIFLLFVLIKFFELSPLLYNDLFYHFFNFHLIFLKFLKIPKYQWQTYGFVLVNYFESFFFWTQTLIFFFVFVAPIFLALLTKNKKLVKTYWLFSTLVDFLLIFFSSFPCEEGFLIGFCAYAAIFGLGLIFLALILRSIGCFLGCLIIRKKLYK